MKKILLILLIFIFPVCGNALEDDDFQIWTEAIVTKQIGKKWKASLSEELRFKDDADRFYYAHTEINFRHRAFSNLFYLDKIKSKRWLEYRLLYLSAGYKHISEEQLDVWRKEKRPYVDLDFRWRFNRILKKILFSNRARLGYRDREELDSNWRFRNKLRATFPWRWTKWELRPYVEGEWFFDFEDIEERLSTIVGEDNVARTRLYAGMDMKFREGFRGTLYLMEQRTETSDDFRDIHVLGLKFKFAF